MFRSLCVVVMMLFCFGCASVASQQVDETRSKTPSKDTAPDGVVCFRFTVMPDGSVADAEIYKSEPVGRFDAEARRALQKWKFKPAISDGKPVARKDAKYCLDFKLDENQDGVK